MLYCYVWIYNFPFCVVKKPDSLSSLTALEYKNSDLMSNSVFMYFFSLVQVWQTGTWDFYSVFTVLTKQTVIRSSWAGIVQINCSELFSALAWISVAVNRVSFVIKNGYFSVHLGQFHHPKVSSTSSSTDALKNLKMKQHTLETVSAQEVE